MSLPHDHNLCQNAELNIIFLPVQPITLRTLFTHFLNSFCILKQGVRAFARWQKACIFHFWNTREAQAKSDDDSNGFEIAQISIENAQKLGYHTSGCSRSCQVPQWHVDSWTLFQIHTDKILSSSHRQHAQWVKVQQENTAGFTGQESLWTTNLLLCIIRTNVYKWQVQSWTPENRDLLWISTFWIILVSGKGFRF